MFVKIGLFLLFVLQASSANDEENANIQPFSPPIYYTNDAHRVSSSQWLYNYYYNGRPAPVIPTGFSAIAIPVSQTNQQPGVFDTKQEPSEASFESCSSPNNEMGICASRTMCTEQFRGRASGSCSLGRVCCINTISRCDEVVLLNNTYWTSPKTPISNYRSPCSQIIRLNIRVVQQIRPICQVRLDFLKFSIAQPNSDSVCTDEYFHVDGSDNKVPVICGNNDGQHMYLNIPPSHDDPTDLIPAFTFDSTFEYGEGPREWNILIRMLPCDVNYLAPAHCLQYFTSGTGKVSSFNWQDAAGTETRQLANQDYSICFRTPPGSQAKMCFTACPVTAGTEETGFSLSIAKTISADETPAGKKPGVSQGLASDCHNDYLMIPGGFNLANPAAPADNMALDRYCGERLNALPNSATSSTVCTTVTPFHIVYRTNGDEKFDSLKNGNRGFCLTFERGASTSSAF